MEPPMSEENRKPDPRPVDLITLIDMQKSLNAGKDKILAEMRASIIKHNLDSLTEEGFSHEEALVLLESMIQSGAIK